MTHRREWKVETYQLEIVRFTSTHRMGSESQLAGPSTTLELPRVSSSRLVWSYLKLYSFVDMIWSSSQ